MVLNLSFRSQKCVATKATMSTFINKVNEHAKVQHVKRKVSNEARTLCSCSSSYNYNVVIILYILCNHFERHKPCGWSSQRTLSCFPSFFFFHLSSCPVTRVQDMRTYGFHIFFCQRHNGRWSYCKLRFVGSSHLQI